MTGAELREYRQEIGLTVEDLASRLGIAPLELEAWEASEVACSDYPVLLEHAMDKIEYDVNGMTDEEFQALQDRINRALEPAASGAARTSE
jgi:transcriptional regulator with XRE-family HTH domain